MTFVACPGFVGEFGLPAHRDVLVAIGEFGHHRAGDPGLGFVGFSTFFLSSLAGRLPLIGSSISC